MRRAVLAACAAAGVAGCGGKDAVPAAAPVRTVAVQRGDLADGVSAAGIVGFRGHRTVIDHAAGTYTRLPRAGARIGCGEALYRVDDRPVLLLCGALPAYRDLVRGDHGADVAQLNRSLHVAGRVFTARTAAALRRQGRAASVRLGQVVFLPGAVRVAAVTAELGGVARPGAPVLRATSDVSEVRVDLDPGQQGDVRPGDRARITLPGGTVAAGRVARLGGVTRGPGGAVLPAYLTLEGDVRGLDQAPVQVDIRTRGVRDALSVPVTAIVGHGDGYAVEVADGAGRRLVDVRLGLFDTAGGRVQVSGAVRAGERIVVPSL